MLNNENQSYYKFTGKARLDKAIHSLEGILRGVTADGRVCDKEVDALIRWLGEHREFSKKHPFNEVIPRLDEILIDGVVDEEERADILWLCNQLTTNNEYYCELSADMQRLHGYLGGIAANGRILKKELEQLADWMAQHGHLSACWPYTEIDSLITAVLQDGVVDEEEHAALLFWFNEFTHLPGYDSENPEWRSVAINGVCAVCPEIQFESKRFCFTGKSARCSRAELEHHVKHRNGTFSKNLTKEVDYLIVGADGNPCWAFACYGRKVELAMQFRKQGSRLLLVHEHDFWDAIEDS